KQTFRVHLAVVRPSKPRSERQREASRRNGARARGPVTDQGKQHSSHNSRRHGFYSQSGLTVSDDARKIISLCREGLIDEFEPCDSAQFELIEALAGLRGALHALAETESTLINNEIAQQRALNPSEAPEILFAAAFQHLCDHSRVLEDIFRTECRLEDQY